MRRALTCRTAFTQLAPTIGRCRSCRRLIVFGCKALQEVGDVLNLLYGEQVNTYAFVKRWLRKELTQVHVREILRHGPVELPPLVGVREWALGCVDRPARANALPAVPALDKR